MSLDLDTARKLHERATYAPEHCTTCSGDTWPCATATALGATGRSEWIDTPERPATPAVCGAVFPGDPGVPCVEPPGHNGSHRDWRNSRWGQRATTDGTPTTPEATP